MQFLIHSPLTLKISHGHAVSLTFNEFMKFNFQNIHKSYNKTLLKKNLKNF